VAREIELKDVGPVEHLKLAIPEDGGVVVLKGAQGVGKSQTLAAIQSLTSGDGKIASRDGSPGAYVEGLGVRITVGRKTARSGELECEALEGVDPSLIVDPRIKDPAAADAVRIRALLRLARAEVPLEAFGELVGGVEKLDDLCRETTLQETDLPAQAAAMKRDFEGAARRLEEQSRILGAKADAAKMGAQSGEGDWSPPAGASAEGARAEHAEMIRAQAELVNRKRSNQQLLDVSRAAAASLEAIEGGTELRVQGARERAAELAAELQALRERLARVEEQHASAVVAVGREERAFDERKRLAGQIEAAASVEAVTDEQLARAEQEVESARAQVERWVIHERTARQRAEAEELTQEAQLTLDRARKMREAAAGTERVLLEALQRVVPDGMDVHEGRLRVKTDRGMELVAELSTGERCRIAFDAVVRSLGPTAVVAMDQSFYQDLDPRNRKEVIRLCKERGLCAVVALVDDGPLRAEVAE